MNTESIIKPRRLFLQWHVTERCNLACRHCYQEEDYIRNELNRNQMLDVYKQYIELVRLWEFKEASVSFTGGEPLIRIDLLSFIEEIKGYTENLNLKFNFRILSNGILLTGSQAEKLKDLGIQNFQVSLEGMQEKNDEIRGAGVFDKTVKAINMLTENGIKTTVSSTLTKKNIEDVESLVDLCDGLGVDTLGVRRLVPCGRGNQLKDHFLEPHELRKHYIHLEHIRGALRKNESSLKIVSGCEQGIIAGESASLLENFCCVVEGRSIAILPNGDVLACRRLPIKIGNALDMPLKEIYYGSRVLWGLRDLNGVHERCKDCSVFYLCLGGAKCVTYSYYDRLNMPDPQCWKFFKSLPAVS